jgi:hypothetical protein
MPLIINGMRWNTKSFPGKDETCAMRDKMHKTERKLNEKQEKAPGLPELLQGWI